MESMRERYTQSSQTGCVWWTSIVVGRQVFRRELLKPGRFVWHACTDVVRPLCTVCVCTYVAGVLWSAWQGS